MATEAPVCHLPPVVDIPQPAPVLMPSIPEVRPDMNSLVAAIQALTQGYQILAGQQKPRQGGVGRDGQPGAPGQKNKKGNWQETDRLVGTVRVTNPQDDSQFVDVQVINKLTMTNVVTGETWVWNR